MRLYLLCPLLFACAAGDALVVVTVSSPAQPLTGLLRFHATVTAAGHDQPFDVSFTDGAVFDVPPDRTFGVQIPEAYTGDFRITVDAIGAGDVTLSSGADSTTTSPGRRSDVTIRLGESGQDMGCVPDCAQAGYGCGTLHMCGMDIDCGPCLLASVHPPIAKAGAPLTLEGAFNPTVQLVFPGGVMATPTLLGPNRALVMVPASAGSGNLGLMVPGGSVALKQPFRRSSFGLALGAFHQVYEQADVARPMTYTNVDRFSGAAALVGSTVQMFGGESGASPAPVVAIEAASANFDGSVGLFASDAARTVVRGRSAFAVYSTPSWLYVAGGYDSARSSLGSVERAAVRPDGSGSDSFTATGTSLKQARWYAASAVIGQYFYVFGGGMGTFGGAATVLRTIERAPISNVDGSLGPFETAPWQTALGRLGAVALVLRDRVYLIGGIDPSGVFLKSIESAPINGDGSLGTFTASPISLNVDRAVAGLVELGNQVYLLGGVSGSPTPGETTPTIESAPVINGTLGAFTLSPLTLADKRAGQPVIVGNWLYYFQRGGGPKGASAERASIIGAANLGAFADSGNSLAQPLSQMATVVIGPDVYLLGGQTATGPSPNILHARADADGALGAFTPMVNGSALPDLVHARAGAAVAAFDRDVWICGGVGTAGGLSDCETLHVNADGSVVAPQAVSDMGTKRVAFHLVALENQLFAVGGEGGGWDSVQSIALDVNHRPTGAWSAALPGQFQVTSGGRMALVIDNNEYALNGDQPSAGVEVATFGAGMLGSFVATGIDAGPVRSDGVLLALGRWVVIAGGAELPPDMGIGNPLDSVFVAAAGPPLANFTDTSRHLLHARRGHAGLVLNNFIHLIGGSDAGGLLGSIEQAPLQ